MTAVLDEKQRGAMLAHIPLGRYLHPDKECWALITGASDGIGFGLAEELCLRGFNVILHSRNRDKLELKKRELEAQFPKSQIAIAVGDAGEGFDAGVTFEEAIPERFEFLAKRGDDA